MFKKADKYLMGRHFFNFNFVLFRAKHESLRLENTFI